jgi:nicotinamidase-related amidase
MKLSSTVLVVVDAQNGFVTDKSAYVIPRLVELIDRWQRAGGEVIFTRYVNYPNSPYERLIHWSYLRDAPETDLVHEIEERSQRPGTYSVRKTIYSLFNDEGASLVAQHGWTDLIITGIATESCVLKTAVDAFERDLTPWVLRDAVASHAGGDEHDAGLLVTERFIGPGQVLTTDQLLDRVTPPVPA